MPTRRPVCAALAVAASALAAAWGLPVAAAAPSTAVLGSDVLPGIDSLHGTPVDPAMRIQVGITFSNPHAAAQNAAYRAIYTPGSPQYHRFLSEQQLSDEFGLPQATFDQALAWARRDGLQEIFAGPTREYLLLGGTAAQVEQTFSVELRSYQARGRSFYANTDGPTVPAGLDVAGVIGLNSFLRAQTFDHQPLQTAPHGASHPAQSQCTGSVCIGVATPQDLWQVYDQPSDISNPAADFGQGQQMAVLGEGNVAQPLGDLRLFEKEFGLPQVPVTVDAIGDSFADTSGTEEWDIDSQSSTGMSPKAFGETWIFADNLSDASVETLFSAFEAAPGIMEANASFGECEEDPTSAATSNPPQPGGGFGGLAGTAGVMFTQASENTLQQATLLGKTLFSSTGDTGSSCPVVVAAVIGAGNGVLNQAYPETSYPASSPYVVAVGGTVLYTTPSTATAPASNATRSQEYPWNFTGGGNTFYIPEPGYQSGVAFLDNQPCVSQPDGTPYGSTTPCRGIPDVAAQSGDFQSNGYAITFGGQPDFQGGGTSLASPLWMGMWARIQAASSATNHGQHTNGFADPALYGVGLDASKDPTAFFDIGAGSATFPPNSNGYYTSQPRTPGVDPSGWDYVSGLGAPDVCVLTKDIDNVATCDVATDNVAAPAPKDCGQPGLPSCTAAVCVAGGPLWTNGNHVSSDLLGNSDPQLSLLQGGMSLSADGQTLVVKLTVNDLTETVPPGAAADEWYMLWTYAGTTYFANAELTDVAATAGTGPTFNDGNVSVTGSTHTYNPVHTDTGSFTTGPNGVVEIDVPVANVGGPTLGKVLQAPSGETDIEVGAPGVGGLLGKVDVGGPACNELLGTGAVNQGTTTAPGGGTLQTTGATAKGSPNTAGAAAAGPLSTLVAPLLTMALLRRRRRARRAAPPG
ncbi:MAG TPA: S53 family peptidase [Candidatus Dormibacteraeota bacterium]|nr:S53 family peptidase [Candidatus Dormibacteraeota bacterium]